MTLTSVSTAGVRVKFAGLPEPVEQFRDEGVKAMRPDPTAGLPEHLGRRGDRGSVAARPSNARRGGHRPRHPSEQPDRRLSVHAGHGDHLVQQPMLVGPAGLLVPLPLHGGVLAQAGSRHGGLHGRIGNRDF